MLNSTQHAISLTSGTHSQSITVLASLERQVVMNACASVLMLGSLRYSSFIAFSRNGQLLIVDPAGDCTNCCSQLGTNPEDTPILQCGQCMLVCACMHT